MNAGYHKIHNAPTVSVEFIASECIQYAKCAMGHANLAFIGPETKNEDICIKYIKNKKN